MILILLLLGSLVINAGIAVAEGDIPSRRDGEKCAEKFKSLFDIEKYLESSKLKGEQLEDERARLKKKMDEDIDVIERESNFDLILIQEKHLLGEPLFLRPSGHKLRPHHGTIVVAHKQQGGNPYVRYRISGGDSIAVKVPMCADDSHAFFNVGTFDGDEQIDFQIIEQRGSEEIVKAARKMSVRPGAYSLRGGIVVIPSSKSADLSIEPAIQINIREAFGEGERVGDAPCRLWPLSWLLRGVSTEDFHCGLSFGITPSSSPVVYTFGPSLEAGDILDLTAGVAVYSVSDSIKVRGFVGTTLDLRILKVILKGAEELVGLK